MEESVTDKLWNEIGRQAAGFDALTSHASDAFSLLAAILAFYEAKGTPVSKMMSPELQERMRFYTERAKEGAPGLQEE